MSASIQTNILVVDDVPDRLVAMEAILGELGQNIVTVTSGREALRCLLNSEFAVILLDVNMPDLDGFETAGLIRQRKRSEHTPIIFVTAWGDEAHAFQGYSLGAVDYILTPVVPEVLRAKVRVFVDLFQKNEQLKRQAEEQAALVALADRRADQLRRMAAQLANAEQRERRRLAQVLHDHVQQLLVAARMRVDRARMHSENEATLQELGVVSELINQTITASRSLATDLSPPVLNEAGLGAALEWLARWMKENYDLEVSVECESDVQPAADEMRVTMFQAVRELLFNVVKHSGSPSATVGVRRDEGEWLVVSVEDRGAGFDAAAVGEQISSSGLGLFSIRERVETLGGRFELEAKPGAGTRILLYASTQADKAYPIDEATAPVADTAAASPFVPVREASPVPAGSERIRVILVDDHAILRKGLRGLLQAKPEIEVVGEAGDGQEAIALVRKLRPDVVVMDINMPRMNGIEATRVIKAEQPSVTVIGLSLHENREVVASLLQAGATSYVTKGGPPDELFQTITSVRPGASTVA